MNGFCLLVKLHREGFARNVRIRPVLTLRVKTEKEKSFILVKLNMLTCADSSTYTRIIQKSLERRNFFEKNHYLTCVMCHRSHVTCQTLSVKCQLSPTPTATATYINSAKSLPMQSRMVCNEIHLVSYEIRLFTNKYKKTLLNTKIVWTIQENGFLSITILAIDSLPRSRGGFIENIQS